MANSWKRTHDERETMKAEDRLNKIAEIIETVDNRCMASDGPVTPTLREMTKDEIREIYQLAINERIDYDD